MYFPVRQSLVLKTPVKGLKTIIFCGILFYIKSDMRFTGKYTFVLAAKVIFRESIDSCLREGILAGYMALSYKADFKKERRSV